MKKQLRGTTQTDLMRDVSDVTVMSDMNKKVSEIRRHHEEGIPQEKKEGEYVGTHHTLLVYHFHHYILLMNRQNTSRINQPRLSFSLLSVVSCGGIQCVRLRILRDIIHGAICFTTFQTGSGYEGSRI